MSIPQPPPPPVPFGNPWGQVYPPRPAIPPPAVDPRTTALRLLQRYVAGLTFYRPGGTDGNPIPFTVPAERFIIEEADHDQDLVFPSIVVTSDEDEVYDSPGLVSDIDEDSVDVYGKGTVLQIQYEQQEFIQLEMWAASKPERRSLLAGLQVALNPTEQQYGIRFVMDDYYGQFVCFTPWSTRRVGRDGVRGRWLARMRVEMRFNVVRPVNVERLYPPVLEVRAVPDDGLPHPEDGK